MVFPIHFPKDKKRFDKFKKLLIEAKRLTGSSYHRILETAIIDLILKERKGQLK